MKERYIAAIDLGSTKTALGIAKVSGEDVEIVYYKELPSEGIRCGAIFNPEKAKGPVKSLLLDAEKALNIHIAQVVTGTPRYEVVEQNGSAEMSRTEEDQSITEEELDCLKNIATDSFELKNKDVETILGAIPQSYSTDDCIQISEEDVVGMLSSSFIGNYKLYIGRKRSLAYIDRVFNDLGVAVHYNNFTPCIEADIVLTEDEKDSGVALFSLGGGVSSVAIYRRGILRHFASIPFGGSSITSDIRLETGFSMDLSENIKMAFGACLPDKLANMSDKILRVSYPEGNSADRELKVEYLSRIIDAREREIINALLWEIEKSGYADELRSGVVLTSGAAEMANLSSLVSSLSGYRVRVGYPLHTFNAVGCSEARETSAVACMGLVMAAKERENLNCCAEEEVPLKEPAREEEEGNGQLFSDDEIEKVEVVKKKNPQPSNKKKGPITKAIDIVINWGNEQYDKSE